MTRRRVFRVLTALWLLFIWGHSLLPASVSKEESGHWLAFLQTWLPWLTDYLIRKVREVKEFAEGDEALVYIDPTDEKYAELIEKKTGIKPIISEESFDGGVRAVIRNRNVLMDNSFKTLTADAEEGYVWVGGGD